jgi:hypothetical protein
MQNFIIHSHKGDIAPFQWILKGRTGVSSKTKFGRFLLRITGEKG